MNFIDEIVKKDIESGKNCGRVCTRIPPEPNGYLHIGHVRSIYVNFGVAKRQNGTCSLYFDDTNPSREKDEYVYAIQEDIKWLGFTWNKLYFASDHYEQLYRIACKLIREGKAYVCNLSADEVREYRGTLTGPGQASPWRERSAEENMDLFMRMRSGEFPEGYCTLRAKIDMASPVICMRDPVIYRIMHAAHYRAGDKWCIYPMYDFASPLVDALEGVTHSLCAIEFQDHRPLYDWVVREAGCFPEPPRQIEFGKLNLTRTVLGKRFLKRLVEDGIVSGWDDPRMATVAGMRRRGYPASAIIRFMDTVGLSTANSTVDYALLEHCVREELEPAQRRMAVLRPVRLRIDNYPEGLVEYAELENHPDHPEMGSRKVPFSRDLYIEAEDFMADPPKKYHRLSPGAEVRLKGAYIVRCTGADYGENGEIRVHCEYDPEKRIGEDGRKVKGTLHWVPAAYAVPVEVRLYDFLLNECDGSQDYMECLNPGSLEVLQGYAEPELARAATGERYQFLRHGYFCVDGDSTGERKVYNRIVSLKDNWKRQGINPF